VIWLLQIRAPFLVLAVFLTLVGAAVALHDGFWNGPHLLLLIAGVVAAHASVNLFNELSDFRTGIDKHTVRTPFSGGSGMLQSRQTSPQMVRLVAYSLLFFSGLIGVYFCFKSGWLILIFMLSGGIAIRFYTSHLAKILLGEVFSGLTLGTFVVLGTYYALTSHLTREIIFVSIPPGILTALLLFLNEIPDSQADRAGGRKHLVIQLGKKKSSVVYAFFMGLVYAFIISTPWVVHAPRLIWLGLLTIPLAVKASVTALKFHNSNKKMVPAQAMNTLTVLLTDLFLAVAYFIVK
jgi:1,4-dihydroxy-2-naphthoate polyprenyltransferase